MIEQTKQEVEHKYCVKNGYDHDAVVSNTFIQWLTLFLDLPNFLLFQKTTPTFIIFTVHLGTYSVHRKVRSNKI